MDNEETLYHLNDLRGNLENRLRQARIVHDQYMVERLSPRLEALKRAIQAVGREASLVEALQGDDKK